MVGSSSLLGPWFASFTFLINAVDIIQEGYERVSLCSALVYAYHHNVSAQVCTIQGYERA